MVYQLSLPQEKNTNSQRKTILWISSIVLDMTLHKTSRIEILEHLAKQGHDVYIITMHSKEKCGLQSSKIHVRSIPLRYVDLISPALYVITLACLLPFYIIKIRPDFVITEPEEQFFSLVSTLLLFPLRKFKVVLDIRSPPVSAHTIGLRGYLKTFNFHVYLRLAKRLFNGITIITTLMKKDICENFRVDPEFVGVWLDGVSTALFRWEKNAYHGMQLRKKFELSDKFIVFYHGRFEQNRGLAETIESISLIVQRYPEIVLFLLGNGPIIDDLKALIQKNELQQNVIVYGPVSYADVPKYIAMCDIGIVPLPDLPYWRNQCPLKLLEYLAMEKTVILTDIPAHREIVQGNKCGIYVSCNPIEIAKSIIYAYENRKRLREWGASGREIVIGKYNWERAARDLELYLLSLDKREKTVLSYGAKTQKP